MGVFLGDCYRISVGGGGDATVTVVDTAGMPVWSYRTSRLASKSEMLCDALVEALSWTAQRHSGRLVVELPERRLANQLVGPSPIEHHSRLSSMLDEARVLLTWFESTDVALRDADARLA